MNILAIESSCDETAVAVTNGRKVLSSLISSQIEEHKIYGGVVPEIASRRHTEAISHLCRGAVEEAGITMGQIDAIAVTYAPGLVGALLVGVNFAKGLSYALNKPVIPVHHLRSHIAANYITNPDLKPPFLCLVVSGGNTVIAMVKDYTDFEILGQTRDDAAGECMDKTARVLGLNYPGGVNLDKIATTPDFESYPLPMPKLVDNELDFSFSGLKTAVINRVHNAEQKREAIDIPVFAATIRKRVCDILIKNTLLAIKKYNCNTLAVAGGVSANSELRARLDVESKEHGFNLYYPQLKYCGDNAAMVGVQAYYEYKSGNIASLDLNAYATMNIDTLL